MSLCGEWRRWRVRGPARHSAFDLEKVLANDVLAALAESAIDVFLVSEDAKGYEFGIPIDQRSAALDAITRLSEKGDWYLEWRRGNRVHARSLTRSRIRAAESAEWWRPFVLFETGQGGTIGRGHSPRFTFWEAATSGHYEKVAARGLERFPIESPNTNERFGGVEFPGKKSLPVADALGTTDEPVDVVYTWVDSSDPEWLASFDRAVTEAELQSDGGHHPSRFSSKDELRYSLRSTWMYAGWARHIYVVTAGQVPDWLQETERLRVVDHREILPADALPTFNSHAIESRLHHIEGLAERFIYMNDDVFFGRSIGSESFFTPNGILRFTESRATVELSSVLVGSAAVDAAAANGQNLLFEVFGKRPRYKLDHAPHPLLKSIMGEVEERFEEARATAFHRFRDPRDLALASGFVQHYAYLTGKALPGDLEIGYMNIENRRLEMFLERVMLGRDLDAFCLNETELERSTGRRSVEEKLTEFLGSYFSVPSPWESH